TGVAAPNADVLLVSNAGALQLNRPATAGTGTVRLLAAGDIAQEGVGTPGTATLGPVIAAALAARSAGGDIRLDRDNAVGTFAAEAADRVVNFRTTGAL